MVFGRSGSNQRELRQSPGYLEHRRRDNKFVYCKPCNVEFNYLKEGDELCDDMTLHILKKHASPRDLPCFKCDRVFSNNTSNKARDAELFEHWERDHGNVISQRPGWFCPFCKALFMIPRKKSLDHWRTEHKDNYRCYTCGIDFTNFNEWMQHLVDTKCLLRAVEDVKSLQAALKRQNESSVYLEDQAGLRSGQDPATELQGGRSRPGNLQQCSQQYRQSGHPSNSLDSVPHPLHRKPFLTLETQTIAAPADISTFPKSAGSESASPQSYHTAKSQHTPHSAHSPPSLHATQYSHNLHTNQGFSQSHRGTLRAGMSKDPAPRLSSQVQLGAVPPANSQQSGGVFKRVGRKFGKTS